MISEAIVLAGGLGTRLKSELPGLPKCLAPVGGKPFLDWLLAYYKKQGIGRFIFALGYGKEQVEQFIQSSFSPDAYAFSIENEPLGTGGALYQACRHAGTSDLIVLNADTFFGLSLDEISSFHQDRKSSCTVALKQMQGVDRYGAVALNSRQQVIGFSEKKYIPNGFINGGVYALHVPTFLSISFPSVFSFEKDYLEKKYPDGKIFGMISPGYFIDIGIPEDYRRAQKELIQHIC